MGWPTASAPRPPVSVRPVVLLIKKRDQSGQTGIAQRYFHSSTVSCASADSGVSNDLAEYSERDVGTVHRNRLPTGRSIRPPRNGQITAMAISAFCVLGSPNVTVPRRVLLMPGRARDTRRYTKLRPGTAPSEETGSRDDASGSHGRGR